MNDFSVLLQQVLLEDIHKEELNAALNAVKRILADVNAEEIANPSPSSSLRPDALRSVCVYRTKCAAVQAKSMPVACKTGYYHFSFSLRPEKGRRRFCAIFAAS